LFRGRGGKDQEGSDAEKIESMGGEKFSWSLMFSGKLMKAILKQFVYVKEDGGGFTWAHKFRASRDGGEAKGKKNHTLHSKTLQRGEDRLVPEKLKRGKTNEKGLQRIGPGILCWLKLMRNGVQDRRYVRHKPSWDEVAYLNVKTTQWGKGGGGGGLGVCWWFGRCRKA